MPGHLEKLEIANFKSYRGKHVIGFSSFSAIIGPNGCGMLIYSVSETHSWTCPRKVRDFCGLLILTHFTSSA